MQDRLLRRRDMVRSGESGKKQVNLFGAVCSAPDRPMVKPSMVRYR